MSTRDLKMQVLLDLRERVLKPLTAIRGSSAETSKEVKALRDQVKNLQAQNDKIDSFKTLSKQTAIVGAELKSAKDRLKAFDAAMTATDKPARKLVEDWKAAKKEVNDLNAKHASMIDRQRKLVTVLGESGIKTNALSAHQRELKTSITETSAALGQQEAKLKAVNAKLQQQRDARAKYDKTIALRDKIGGAGIATTAAGVGVGAGVLQTVKAYAELEDAGAQLRASMMKKDGSSANFEELNALAIKLGNRLPGTTADFQNMMTMLIRQGQDAKTILGGLGEATAYLGVQTKMSQVEAAEFAAKLSSATRTPAKDMMGLMDIIQKTFYLGVNQNDMLQAFSKLSPALSTLKKEGLEAGKALAPLIVMANKTGMAGESSGNAIRKVLQLGLDTKKVGKGNAALAGTGIKLDFTNGKGNFGGMDNLFAQLAKLKGLTDVKRTQVLKQIFGDDAETHMVLGLMIEQGKAGYEQTIKKMEDQAALQERVNKQLSTLSNLWEAATGTFTNTLAAFGETLSPQLKDLTKWINDTTEAVGAWAKKHPELSKFLMQTIAVIAVLLVSLGGIAVAAAAILGPLAMLKISLATLGIAPITSMVSGLAWAFNLLMKGVGLAGNVILWLGRMLLTTPIGWIITGIALAAFLIYKYWEPIKAFFSGLWDAVSAHFKIFIDAHMQSWLAVRGAVGQAADWIKKKFSGLVDWFTGLPAAFLELGSQMVNGILNGLSAGWGKLKAKIAELSQMLPEPVRNALGFTAKIENSGALAPAPALVTGSAIKPSANNSMVIHSQDKFDFNVYAAPGQSAEDIGKKVRKEIDERDRQRAARARARFTDRD